VTISSEVTANALVWDYGPVPPIDRSGEEKETQTMTKREVEAFAAPDG
jgi:hypothetical protein